MVNQVMLKLSLPISQTEMHARAFNVVHGAVAGSTTDLHTAQLATREGGP